MRPIALFAFSLTAFLSACATQDPGQDPTGTWVGSLIADQGTCPTSLTSTLRIRGREIMFTPGDSSKVLRGTYVHGSNHYHAELIEQDMNHHATPLVFNGYPVGQAIGGIYGSNACRAHITMTRR
ncbi:hypothetical protein JK185_01160 [Gluconobacter wancherniae]|uniref:hypothetical protein n=1 Tax=Gluconobacter wancherniae TaxID=1307955 RepID=UPI001B8C764E|nr:hypothetical protein [Gluconobacter wancherniae]MBS1061658.1 hypothetical protein [Gluconobacter wancherniae]